MKKNSSTKLRKVNFILFAIGISLFLTSISFAQSKLDIKTPQVQVSCNGACDGSINALVTGGTQPYSYLWSTGATTSSISGLCAAYYSLTVTDANGEVEHASNSIAEPAVLLVNLNPTNPTCPGSCNGALASVVSGGRPGNNGYIYLWSTGSTSSNISGLCAGAYSVTVRDSRGCIANNSSTLSNDPLLLDISSTPENCFQDCEGIANAIVSGGTQPYNFVWSNGAQSAEAGKLCSGVYTVTVSDANGCSISGSVTITGPSKGLTAACVVLANESAPGAANGSMNASGDGGNAPYSFVWSNGATTALNSNLVAGIYTVTVSDAKGCSSTSSCEIKGNNCNGQFRTQTQGGWGQCHQNGNNPGTYLAANFASAFPNGLTIGACGKTIKLTSSSAVCAFLPSGSTPRALTASLINPGGSYKNVLAGQVAALSLSVGFDANNPNFGSSASGLGGQIVISGTFAGWSVQQILNEANRVLGGCASAYSASTMNGVVSSINENYVDGTINKGFLRCPSANGNKLAQSVNNNLIAYPNPFSNTFNLELIDKTNSMNVLIMDITGKVVMNAVTIGESALSIGENLNAGIYFIIATDVNGQSQKLKIIKQ